MLLSEISQNKKTILHSIHSMIFMILKIDFVSLSYLFCVYRIFFISHPINLSGNVLSQPILWFCAFVFQEMRNVINVCNLCTLHHGKRVFSVMVVAHGSTERATLAFQNVNTEKNALKNPDTLQELQIATNRKNDQLSH